MLAKLFKFSLETADSRRFPRIPEEHATAIIDETVYKLNDWNPKGFMITPYEGRYGIGSSLQATLVIPFGRKILEFVVTAKVARLNKKSKQLAAVFSNLDAETTNQLELLAAAKRYV